MINKQSRRLFLHHLIVIAFLVFVAAPTALAAEVDTSKGSAPSKGMISLAEAEPEVHYAMLRYGKFYGDTNTLTGGLFERSYLLGDMGGFRDTLVDYGLYLDLGVTQFLQWNVSGGNNDGSARNNGTADYSLIFDSGKAGLWPGGAVYIHGESSWKADQSLAKDTGSLLPPAQDAFMPVPGDSTTTLSEVFFNQGLPNGFLLTAGKANWAGLADGNTFANNERTQFSYTGLINNPILGAFVPYTPWGAGLSWVPNKHHTFVLVAVDSAGTVKKLDFDTAFNRNTTTLGGQYQYTRLTAGLPGSFRILLGYNSKDLASFDISERHFIGEALGVLPTIEEDDNYTVIANFEQYLWVKGGSVEAYNKMIEKSGYPGVARHHLQPMGIGIFGRVGWAPKDRNVIDQFYSFGIGGIGEYFTGRPNDQWGIGYSATHISKDLRDLLDPLVEVDEFEHAGEIFYNFEVTPAIHLTLNTQIIDSPLKSTDTAYTFGSRLQLDF